jgi:hypothetical protein
MLSKALAALHFVSHQRAPPLAFTYFSRTLSASPSPSPSPFPYPQDAAAARRLLLDNQRLAAEVAASTDEALADARAALERRARQLEAVRAQKAQLQVRSSVNNWVASLLASERRECVYAMCICASLQTGPTRYVSFWVVYLLLVSIPFDTQIAHSICLSGHGE